MNFLRRIGRSLNFTRGEQIATITLLIIVAILLFINFSITQDNTETAQDKSLFNQLIQQQDSIEQANAPSLFAFDPNTIDRTTLSSLDIPDRLKNNIINYRKAGGSFHQKSDLNKLYCMNDSIYAVISPYISIKQKEKKKKETIVRAQKPSLQLFPFNPNTISKDSLELLDMPEYAKRNLIKYREKGGQIKTKEKLASIYGMTEPAYQKLLPYIVIPRQAEVAKKTEVAEQTTKPKTEAKVSKVIELNSCTAEDLKQLRGIGDVLSERIINYRDLLGGFYKVDQLNEVYNLRRQTIENNRALLRTDKALITKININFSSKKELSQHPYIDYKLANKIIRFRSKHGYIDDISALKQIVDESDFSKLENYITP